MDIANYTSCLFIKKVTLASIVWHSNKNVLTFCSTSWHFSTVTELHTFLVTGLQISSSNGTYANGQGQGKRFQAWNGRNSPAHSCRKVCLQSCTASPSSLWEHWQQSSAQRRRTCSAQPSCTPSPLPPPPPSWSPTGKASPAVACTLSAALSGWCPGTPPSSHPDIRLRWQLSRQCVGRCCKHASSAGPAWPWAPACTLLGSGPWGRLAGRCTQVSSLPPHRA